MAYQQTPAGIFYRPELRADSEADIAARPDAWLRNAFAGPQTTSGIRVTPQQAFALPAYYAAIRNIGEDVAKIPLITYRRAPRGKVRLDTATSALLHDNMDMRQTLTAWALGWGNGYAEIERARTGDVVALHLIHPRRIPPRQAYRDAAGALVYRVYPEPTRDVDPARPPFVDIPEEDMLHIKGLGDDGLFGFSVAQMLAESIGVNLAGQTFAAAFFGNGMNAGGVFEHPAALSDTAQAHLKESLTERYGGVRNAFKPMVLEEGMTFSRQAIPPNEAQFIESRQFGIEEIARMFRISPHKIQHLLRSTFNNIEQLALEHVTDTLMPWLIRWEQEILRKVFLGQPGVFAEHLVAGLLRGDMKTRGEFYTAQFNMGALTINEIRAFEGLNPLPIPEADLTYIQMNMTTLQKLGAEAPPAIPEPGEQARTPSAAYPGFPVHATVPTNGTRENAHATP